ncbi:hypothetical protein T5B8_03271 [Salinisphaera sp. T5B8]|uniref:toxin-antitoxin system YwqK family antitoxin n=1 Tax=Salinisphaera sp. T5B8 TaxID=1304154 RepID=UPI003342BF97
MITRARHALAAGLLVAAGAVHAQDPTRFWYDAELNPVDDAAAATYRVSVQSQRDGIGWPAELRRIEDDALRMRGYVAKPERDDTDVTWIGHYALYRMNGEHRLAEVGTADAQARYQGLMTTFDAQGRLERAALYRDGELEGKTRQYVDGKLYSVTDYENGEREGIHAQYVQGALFRIEEYHHDRLDGVTEQYSTGDRAWLVSRVEYRDGRPDGWAREYEAGKTVAETRFVNGRKDGPQRQWHDQEKNLLSEIVYYRDGEQVSHDIVNRYNVNDQVTAQTVLDRDGRLLVTTRYDTATGQPKTRVRHVRDTDTPKEIHEYFDRYGYVEVRRIAFPQQAHEIELRFAADGQITYRRELRDHHRVGLYIETLEPNHSLRTHYDDNGKRQGKEVEIRHGKIVKMTTWADGQRNGPFFERDYGGQRTEGQYVDDKLDGEYRVVDSDQQLIEIAHYDEGSKDGLYERYDRYADDDKPVERGHYVDGVRHGAWIETSASGGPTWHGRYRKGQKIGRWQAVNAEGYPLTEGNFEAGQRSGLWLNYRHDGELDSCELYRNGERVDTPPYDPNAGQTRREYCNGLRDTH